MSETNIKVKLAGILYKTIDKIQTVLPITYINSVLCFQKWLDSYYRIGKDELSYIQSDYFNGSENDLENIFLEIVSITTIDNCIDKDFLLKRLNFLANEGLHIVELQNAKNSSFKVTKQEADKIILGLSNKTKKTSKVQVKKKSTKKIGHLVKNK